MTDGSPPPTIVASARVGARHDRWWLPAAMLLLAGALFLGVMVGPAGNWGTASWNIVWNVRMPRVALAGIVGAMLSIAGASYQGVFRNPLVDPYLLGVAAGAGLGATIVFALGRATTTGWLVDPLPLASFVGGLLAVLLTYLVGSTVGAGRTGVTWSWPASRSRRWPQRSRRSCSSATMTSFARCTAGSSVG